MRRVIAICVMMLALSGSVLPLAGCLADNLWRFNPCGTILSTNICTPDEWYRFVFDSPDWDVDPACPIPFQCQ